MGNECKVKVTKCQNKDTHGYFIYNLDLNDMDISQPNRKMTKKQETFYRILRNFSSQCRYQVSGYYPSCEIKTTK